MAITRSERRREACDPMCISANATLAFLRRDGSERTNDRRADLHPPRIGKFFKHRFESRIGLTNAFSVLDDGLPFGKQARDGKSHRDAMIPEARQPRAVQRRWSINFKP